MSYCIAFSIDGATDVTRRYIRNPTKHGKDRTRAPEEVLLWVIHEIRRMRRENLSKEERRRLMKEDEREERELRAYMAQAIATEINNLLPGPNTTSSTPSDEQKTPVAVQDGTAEWINARPQGGLGQSGPDRSRDRR
jgi:peptide-N4-(N-acetyl-beta-glucosaminyl)asparagine amidase